MSITPLVQADKLATALDLPAGVFAKREDLNPYGSHKGRSLPGMIARYVKLGTQRFCISSSGNAALAAILYINEYNEKHADKSLTLDVFVGEHINPEKLSHLQSLANEHVGIRQVKNPRQSAFQMEKKNDTQRLSQSLDDTALSGYYELAKEIYEEIPTVAAIFVPTSSGTAAEGLDMGFKKIGIRPEIHIIQTQSIHPIVDFFRGIQEKTASAVPSLADAIVDKIAARKAELAKVLKESHGDSWIATNNDITKALSLAKKTLDFTLSPNAALSLAGLQHALGKKKKFAGPVVLLITGK